MLVDATLDSKQCVRLMLSPRVSGDRYSLSRSGYQLTGRARSDHSFGMHPLRLNQSLQCQYMAVA